MCPLAEERAPMSDRPARRLPHSGTPWADPAAYWAAMTRCRRRGVRSRRGARTSPRSATTRSTWWSARAACRSASRASRCACATCIDATLAAARLPRHPRLHAARGAVARRDARRRRARLPERRPRGDRRAGRDERAARRVTLMVDDLAQLDVVDAVAAPGSRAELRVAIDADASWRAPGLGHIGVHRSPVHDAGRGRQPRPARSPRGPASASSA